MPLGDGVERVAAELVVPLDRLKEVELHPSLSRAWPGATPSAVALCADHAGRGGPRTDHTDHLGGTKPHGRIAREAAKIDETIRG